MERPLSSERRPSHHSLIIIVLCEGGLGALQVAAKFAFLASRGGRSDGVSRTLRLIAPLPVIRSCRVGLLIEDDVFSDVGRAHADLHVLLTLLDANIAATGAQGLLLLSSN